MLLIAITEGQRVHWYAQPLDKHKLSLTDNKFIIAHVFKKDNRQFENSYKYIIYIIHFYLKYVYN